MAAPWEGGGGGGGGGDGGGEDAGVALSDGLQVELVLGGGHEHAAAVVCEEDEAGDALEAFDGGDGQPLQAAALSGRVGASEDGGGHLDKHLRVVEEHQQVLQLMHQGSLCGEGGGGGVSAAQRAGSMGDAEGV